MTDRRKVSRGASGASSKRRPRTLRVFSPATEEDWRHAGLLIAELKEWDARQSQVLGFAPDEVMSVFYPDGMADIRRHSVSPLGCLRISSALLPKKSLSTQLPST